MGNAVIGALRVNLGLDTAEFQNGIKQSQAATSKFGAGLKTAFAAVAAGMAASLAGLAVSIKSTLGEVNEITKSAQLSNTGFEDFQRLAYAARSVNVEGDKLADIFKDVNDRVGEFNQTGGGEMKDFFTNIAPKVGITADAFRNLSGPQALQLYYDSLKKAGANQQQMIFYLEAMADEATALIPLLENGGEGFRTLGQSASVISQEAGGQLRAFNQSLGNLGQSFSDVALSAVAALAPALVVVASGLDSFAAGIRSVAQYLPQLAADVAVAAGALAVMFSPAIIGGVTTLTLAIGTGLVGAVRLLTAAIAANPLGAIAVGSAVAVAAVYHFRDEIQKAVGVDVVQIAKNAGNLVIGSFVAAFEDIKLVWNAFPSIIGAAVIGAANAIIRTVNGMVDKVKTKINDMISAINSVTGAGLGMVNTGDALAEFANPAAENVAKAVAKRNANVRSALSKDWIGQIGAAFQGATPAVTNFGNAIAGVNKQLAAGSSANKGGRTGKTEAEDYADIIDKANRRIASLQAERDAIGLTAEAAAELQYQTDLLNMAQQRGITLTDGQKTELSGLARSMAAIEVATDKMKDALDFAKSATDGFLSDFSQGIKNGEGLWKSFGAAALNVLDKIADRIQKQFVDALFSSGTTAGGSAGGLGSLFSGLGKMLGFARGGTILPGGAGGIDSQLVAFRKSPNERVDITKPGQTLSSGAAGGKITLEVVGEPGPMFIPTIKAHSQEVAVDVVQQNNAAQKTYRQNGGDF